MSMSGVPLIINSSSAAFRMEMVSFGMTSSNPCTMAANCSQLNLVGEIANLEAPFSPVGPDNSTAGPFGPFQRDVQLTHPIDITVPVESRMGLGILEFRFQKGLAHL